MIWRGRAAPDRSISGKNMGMPTVWATRVVGAKLAIR